MSLTSTNRRQFLAAGAAGLMALRGGGAAADEAPGFGRARSCILVYLLGGPPHQDMWDLKPDAPAEIRGEFRPIATSVPGLSISEHLPRLSRLAHRYSLVRSVTHPNHNHTHMIYYTLTGRHMTQPNLNDNVPNPPSRADHPHMGSVLSRYRPTADGLPGYVALPELSIRMQPVTLQGGHAGFLGPRYDPFAVNEDPSHPDGLRSALRPERIGPDRTQGREALLARIDGRSPASRPLREYAAVREAAVRLTGSPRASRLFFLDDEAPHVRDRYGRHRFGQSLLLARRLAEAGIPMVAVHFNYMSQCDGWDTHSNNFACLKDELLPLLDEGLSALLDDLDARGTLEETLVVCMGEFGRTPRINANAGRDHWGSCASVLLAGGGVKPGRVVGSSDRFGAYPESDPHDPTEVQATIYHALGLRPDRPMIDPTGRPMPVCTARPMGALLS